MFFVISGFLITGILANGFAAGKPVLRTFWIRRVRRLLPALVVVTLFTLGVFASLYPPVHYERVAETALSHLLLSSNIFLWSQSGYFNANSELNPLLHTWSLSVEEQFYAVFPFVVFLLVRVLNHRASFAVVLSGTVLSFLASIYFSATAPSAAFYLLPTRAWELGAGATLALLPTVSRGRSERPRGVIPEVLSLSGMAAIAAACFSFTESTPFPGPNAIVPVAGTFLVLWSTDRATTMVGRLLEWRPLVWVGLISYSLYLWHWVLLVAARSVAGSHDTAVSMSAVLISIPTAWLSWRFVEVPFRNSTVTDRQIIRVAIPATVVVAALAGWIMITDGLPARFEEMAIKAKPPARQAECFEVLESGKTQFCDVGAEGLKPSFVMIGDSHVLSFLPVVDQVAAELGTAGLFSGISGCLPFVDAIPIRRDQNGILCSDMVDRAATMVRSGEFSHLVLAARWMYYTQPRESGGFTPVTIRGEDGRQTLEESRAAFAETLQRTVQLAEESGVALRVIIQVPQQAYDPETLHIRQQSSRAFSTGLPLSQHLDNQRWFREELSRQLDPESIINFDDVLCDSGECIAFAEGVPLYSDDDHLSEQGSLFLLDRVRSWLKRDLCGNSSRAAGSLQCEPGTGIPVAAGSE